LIGQAKGKGNATLKKVGKRGGIKRPLGGGGNWSVLWEKKKKAPNRKKKKGT